jgi:hypothetical protein
MTSAKRENAKGRPVRLRGMSLPLTRATDIRAVRTETSSEGALCGRHVSVSHHPSEAVRHSGRCDAGRNVVLAHGIGMPDRIADFVQGVRSNSGKLPGCGIIEKFDRSYRVRR